MSIIVACLHAPQPMEILPTKRIFGVSTVFKSYSPANLSLRYSAASASASLQPGSLLLGKNWTLGN